MARKPLPSILNRPAALLEHRHDTEWSQKGQRLAIRMAEYVFEALAVARKTQPQIPRILVYEPVITPMGKWKLPMTDAQAIYYPENYVGLMIPPGPMKTLIEYDRIKNSSIIGEVPCGPKRLFVGDLSHEMAHWVIDRVLKPKKAAIHGYQWRMAYALLRERFVNGKARGW